MKHLIVSRRSSGAVRFFEPLEQRFLLCSTPAELIANGVPAAIIHDDGHISRSDFNKLAPKLQAHIDPHWVADDPTPGGIDYDKLLGLPLHPEGPPVGLASGGPDADALPDFFPQMIGGASLDQTTQPGRNLVRFGTQVNNQGAGPGCLISNDPGAPIPTGAPITSWTNPDGSQNVLQPVFNYTGSGFVLSYYRAAGRFTYHPGHGHLHYEGYASYKLRQNNGGVPGAYVMRADGSDVVGAKVGFCLLTFSGTFTTESGQNSSTLPGYNQDTGVPSSCGYNQGIRVGHYDQYSSGLEGQWIDVTGVPNGSYFIEISLDAQNAMLESNDVNNTKTFAYNLNASPPVGGIPKDVFDTPTHNDSVATATDMGEMGTFTQTGLTIDWGQDKDYFEFDATSTGAGSISTTAANGDVNLYLYDSNGVLLDQSTNAGGTDTVNWNFVAGQEYYVKADTYNSTTSSNYQIAWNIKPTINASTTDSDAGELGNNSGIISIARNGPVSSPLTVNFAVGGSATRGSDYNIYHDGVLVSGTSFVIGNLASIGDLEIRPIADGTIEATENVTITLSNNSAYVIGAGTSGAVTIHDTPPQVSQSVQTWQTSPHKLAFTFTLDVGASFDSGDVVIQNLDTSATVTPASIVYTAGNKTAVVTFTGVLPDGHYRATLSGSGITHALGEPMGADYLYNFFVMTADANHDGVVNVNDFTILASNFGQSPRDGSQGDFNYDGIVNVDDFTILASRFGTALASTSGRSSGIGTKVTTGPSAMKAFFADGKKISDTQRELLALLA